MPIGFGGFAPFIPPPPNTPTSPFSYPTSLTNSHNIAVSFTIYTAGCAQVLYQSPIYVNGTPQWPNAKVGQASPFITGGKVTAAKSATVRSQFTMTLVDPTGVLVPKTATDPLTCWGNEIRIYRGIAKIGGGGAPTTFDTPCLGTFRITDVGIDDSKGAPVFTIKGQDRSRIPSRNKVVNFYQTGTGLAYTDVIRSALQFVYPGITFNDSAQNWYQIPPAGIGTAGGASRIIYTDSLVPLLYQEGADLWAEMKKIAATLACDLSFDRNGVCTLVLDPNLNYMSAGNAPPTPVATFIEGSSARFTGVSRSLSDQNGYNQWIITGEGQVIGVGALRSAPAFDSDPNSPTYIRGPYGVVTGFETNALMKTQNQIDTYAQFKLKTTIGAQDTLQTLGWVDTKLSVDDPIAITRSRIGLNYTLAVIDSIDYPLLAKDTQTIKYRERRAIL